MPICALVSVLGSTPVLYCFSEGTLITWHLEKPYIYTQMDVMYTYTLCTHFEKLYWFICTSESQWWLSCSFNVAMTGQKHPVLKCSLKTINLRKVVFFFKMKQSFQYYITGITIVCIYYILLHYILYTYTLQLFYSAIVSHESWSSVIILHWSDVYGLICLHQSICII